MGDPRPTVEIESTTADPRPDEVEWALEEADIPCC